MPKMLEILRPDIDTSALAEDILASQLRPFHKPFADGLPANNHLDMGYDELANDHLRRRLVKAGGEMLLASEIEYAFIAAVPNGASGYGAALAEHGTWAHKPLVLTFEKIDTRVFGTPDRTAAEIEGMKRVVDGRPRGIVVDDATTNGGTTEAMADYLTDEHGLEIVLAMSMFYRGDLRDLAASKYPRAVVVAHEIPRHMDWDAFNKDGTIKASA